MVSRSGQVKRLKSEHTGGSLFVPSGPLFSHIFQSREASRTLPRAVEPSPRPSRWLFYTSDAKSLLFGTPFGDVLGAKMDEKVRHVISWNFSSRLDPGPIFDDSVGPRVRSRRGLVERSKSEVI